MNNLSGKKIILTLIGLNLITLFLFVATIKTYAAVIFGALFIATISILYMAITDIKQTKHALLRNYPYIARFRWIMESERSKIQQYFIEDDISGVPFNREKRSDVYQKAKKQINTTPFGTQLDVYAPGYEFLKHSMYPIGHSDVKDLRITVGGSGCLKPYNASIYNISAMSYGSLSDAAIMALNGGAKLGNFYHNTGEGGISPFHLTKGGDLCFQIGTGYFGAGKTENGVRMFDAETFIKNVSLPQVKMIEIKLSQGAKPGHGGILPASKNTPEIAAIRGIEPGEDVISPPYHTAFHDSESLIRFIQELRFLSEGKPIGIKMCVGNDAEIINLIFAMTKADIYPDFITIDGGEGGTGASPFVFTNSIGTPLIEGLIFVDNLLKNYGVRDKVKIIASGKASNSYDVIKLLSLGADMVNAARSFMLSLGCIQARECNKNTCPVGIATQNKHLIKGLDPALKEVRVFNYHSNLMKEIKEVMGAMGVDETTKLNAKNIYVRVDRYKVQNYGEIYA